LHFSNILVIHVVLADAQQTSDAMSAIGKAARVSYRKRDYGYNSPAADPDEIACA